MDTLILLWIYAYYYYYYYYYYYLFIYACSDVPASRVRACKQEELNMAVRVFGHTHFWVGMRRMSAGICYTYLNSCIHT